MNRKGQALVEFVLILPIFIMILFSIVDFGMIFNKKNELENISADVVNMLNKDIPLEEIKSEYADIDIEISSDDKYKNVVISDKIDILTPGLNRILGNPYEVKVERKIPNV
ncbi:MAG: pilus assembly protein [Firmicutes bacterium]|nr:pilus assembly protein [Bacillota bacterium]MDY5335415.1 TadE family protein [Bacilli bacterium]